jgi:hypothetical protein
MVDDQVVNQPLNEGFLASDDQLIVDLNNHGDCLAAEGYFIVRTEDEKMEGVVIKPLGLDLSKPLEIPEYMKVRNERYLTLIYGYDYKRRYDRMVATKNISNKVRISITESNLGRKMLAATDDERPEFIVKMITQLNQEKELDPRL